MSLFDDDDDVYIKESEEEMPEFKPPSKSWLVATQPVEEERYEEKAARLINSQQRLRAEARARAEKEEEEKEDLEYER